MPTLRFLQFSDLHFENRDYRRQWECPPDKMEIIEGETREVIEKIVTLARDREVEAILIPGDLFDDRTMSLDGIRFLQDRFQGLGEIPVFIAPGNEDAYGLSSFYNSDFLKEIGKGSWPKNVHILYDTPTAVALHPGREHIAITGIPHVGRGLIKERLLANPIPKDETQLNVLVFHGTWEKRGALDEDATLPFDTQELLSQRFDYAAFGHVHQGEEITDEGGKIRGAASGCPYGRRIDEPGEKTIIVGQIEPGGVRPENMERIGVAPRRVHDVKISCRGLKKIEPLRQRIEKALHRENVEATDLVAIRLEGRFNPNLLWKIYKESVKEMYFLTKMDTSGVEADLDFQKYARGIDKQLTTEGLFVRKMQELVDKAENLQERRTLEKALEWGLGALANKRVELDYENQEF